MLSTGSVLAKVVDDDVGTRKLIIVSLIVAVILLANVWALAGWLDHLGLIGLARDLRSEYLTGRAIAVIVALLIVLSTSAGQAAGIRRCPVCDHVLLTRGRYCGECGSRV